METYVQCTDNGDGSADFTLSFADDSHRFTVSRNGSIAEVEYEETMTYRGQIRVSKPSEEVYKELMQSEEMTAFLESNNIDSVRRADRQT